MPGDPSIAERLGRLEAQMNDVRHATRKQDQQIEKLESDLIVGMRAQEQLLREVVQELKDQHDSLKSSYEKMNSFTKGVIWFGGIMAAGVALLYKIDIKGFFS